MNPEPLLTIKETSIALNVPAKTLYLWSKRGQIPVIRVGRHLRFNLSKVMEYFETQTEAARAASSGAERLSDYGSARSVKTRRDTRTVNFTAHEE
jgi:excisionase family DNA binding protein